MLRHVHRQSDAEFVAILHAIRSGGPEAEVALEKLRWVGWARRLVPPSSRCILGTAGATWNHKSG